MKSPVGSTASVTYDGGSMSIQMAPVTKAARCSIALPDFPGIGLTGLRFQHVPDASTGRQDGPALCGGKKTS
jgi:hypothetical protein